MSKPKTKLLFLLEPTAMAGAERVVINLINYLDQNKLDISLAVHDKYLPEFKSQIFVDINYIKYNADPGEKISFYRFDRLKKITDQDFDVISTHQNLPMIYLSMINPQATIVHTQHIAEKWRRFFWPDPFSENSNDQYVAVSSSVKDFLIAQKHIEPERISVIHNGIDLEHWQSNPPVKLNKKFGVKDDDIIVGYLGRLSPQKNLEIWLDIAGRVSRQSDKYKFFIVGSGPNEIILKEKAAKEGIPVTFVGWTDKPYDYLAFFDIFLNTSLYEGMSLAHLEALYAQDYLLTTPVEGINDLQSKLTLQVIDNYDPDIITQALLKYKPADLSGNPDIIKNHFSAEVMASQYEKIFLHTGSFWDQEIDPEISKTNKNR